MKKQEVKGKELKKKINKKNNGITLIALVITIIVLLILAAVTIATLTGENGILNRAAEAKEKTEEAQRKEEADSDYMDKYIDKVVNNKSLVLNKGTVYPLDENLYKTTSFQDNGVGKAEYSTEQTVNAQKSIKITRYAENVNPQKSNCVVGVPLNIDLSKSKNLGIWVYCTSESYKNLDSLTIQFRSTDYDPNFGYGENNCLLVRKYQWDFSVGWNFLNLSIDDYTKMGNLDLSSIKYLILSMVSADNTKEVTMYFDSVVVDYRMKPTLLLNFDSGSDVNIYEEAYPLIKSKGLIATAFVGSTDNFGEGGNMTKEQYNEMKTNGWEFGMYGGMSINGTDEYVGHDALVDASYEEQYKTLNDKKNLLLSFGYTDLVSYSCPANNTSSTNIKVLSDLGFKIVRAGGNYYNYPYKELTQGKYFQIQDNNLETIKNEIDRCINTGYCISIFTHGIKSDDTDYCSYDIYQQMLDYVKQKIDAGELQVMTYKDFYEACSME